MLDLLFGNSAGWFTLPAAVGSFVFILRLIFMSIGGDAHAGVHGGDIDVDVDMDMDLDVGGADADMHGDHFADSQHGDPGLAFRALSIQSIAAFLMGFGFGGLGAYRGAGWSLPTSLVIAAAIGIGFVWLVALMMQFMSRLEASGNLSIRDAVGREGSVYVTVPPNGKGSGQVTVILENRQRIFRAINEEDGELSRNTRIRVTKVNDARTLTVRRV